MSFYSSCICVTLNVSLFLTQVNNVDFGHFTREEAANFLLNIKKGELVEISTQNKMDRKFITKPLM